MAALIASDPALERRRAPGHLRKSPKPDVDDSPEGRWLAEMARRLKPGGWARGPRVGGVVAEEIDGGPAGRRFPWAGPLR